MPAARKAIDKRIDILCAGSPPEAVGLCDRAAHSERMSRQFAGRIRKRAVAALCCIFGPVPA